MTIETGPTTTVFKNARVFTSADATPTLHDTLVVRDDKVLYVGREAEAAKYAENATVSDLGGKVVLPGMIDAHTHLVMMGGSLSKVNCLGLNPERIGAALKQRRAQKPEATMLLGCQFQYDALGKAPHRADLDAAIPDLPVIIESSCYHSAWLNSAAIAAVGVTRDTPDPKGGEIVRDAAGEPTGWFKETAVMEYLWPWIARQTSVADRVELLKKVFAAYLSVGVTGAIDLATTAEDLAAMEAYDAQYGLPMRVACHWLVQPKGTDESRAEQVRTAAAHRDRLAAAGNKMLKIAGIKIVSDGVVDSCTAFLSEPYANGVTSGPIWPADELNRVVIVADALGLQVAVHAIGDAASAQALDAFEAAVAANGEKPERRHRIEHLEVVSKESIARLTRLGVIASMQPVHADPVKVVNWCEQLGHDDRCARMFPWSEFEEAGSHVAFGSDAPTAPYFPLPGIYTATTHKSGIDPKRPEPTEARELALQKLCISLETSIKYYSAGSAFSMHAEGVTGKLVPGLSADFAVLDIDPFADGLETLRDAQKCVVQTYVQGKLVFEKK